MFFSSNNIQISSVDRKANENIEQGVSVRDIRWSNINFTVTALKKKILSDCWGEVAVGQVCAILGPSGAGKSSLLNVLAGRQASSSKSFITGKVEVGGRVVDPVAYRQHIAYVMQDDALLATATPREAITFSAYMRLPRAVSKEQITAMVDKLLADLGILECADVLIGGALIKGISGGQRKRTSVGVELITNPDLLFLDEPTSGLDSFSAFNLVTLLKNVAAKNSAILCTIHQPSSEVFFLFDKCIYVKQGRIFYQGRVDDIVNHFQELGHQCPENYNPSDFVMNLCQTETKEDVFAAIPAEFQADNSCISISSTAPVSYADDTASSSTPKFTPESSFAKQLFALTYREVVSNYRDTGSLAGRFGLTIFLNVLFGLIFLGVGSKSNGNTSDFNNHVGGVSMLMIIGLFGSAQSVMLNFPFERPMFLREFSTGTYGGLAYFITKTVVEVPLVILQLLLQYLISYFMMDLQGNFILLVLATFGLSMTSNSLAMLLGCLVADVKDVTELAPLLFVPQILFGGFFIRTSLIPVWLRWAQYVCGMKYGMNLVFMNEFRVSSPSCAVDPKATANCSNLLSSNSVDTSIYYVYILILLALCVVFRLTAGIVLVRKASAVI
eukprot:gene26163-34779_t